MPWINIVPPDEADGLLKQIYDAARRRAGKVFNILSLQSRNPRVARASIDLYLEVMHGESPLTRCRREMIAVVVSRANDCHY